MKSVPGLYDVRGRLLVSWSTMPGTLTTGVHLKLTDLKFNTR